MKQSLHSVQWLHLHLRWHLVCLTRNSGDQQADLMNATVKNVWPYPVSETLRKICGLEKNKAIFLEQHTSFAVSLMWVAEWLARWLYLHFRKWEMSSGDLIHHHRGFLQTILDWNFLILFLRIELKSKFEVEGFIYCLHINQCSDSEQINSKTAHKDTLFWWIFILNNYICYLPAYRKSVNEVSHSVGWVIKPYA